MASAPDVAFWRGPRGRRAARRGLAAVLAVLAGALAARVLYQVSVQPGTLLVKLAFERKPEVNPPPGFGPVASAVTQRRVAVLRGVEIHQLPRQARQHQARIADHRQQHLAQRLGLRRLQLVRGRGHRRQADVAEMGQLARQRAGLVAEVLLDLVPPGFAVHGRNRGRRGLREQRRGQQRVLGQRGDDDGGLDGTIDGGARHAPGFQLGGVRVDRTAELGGTGM